jgi:hypothetical protein
MIAPRPLHATSFADRRGHRWQSPQRRASQSRVMSSPADGSVFRAGSPINFSARFTFLRHAFRAALVNGRHGAPLSSSFAGGSQSRRTSKRLTLNATCTPFGAAVRAGSSVRRPEFGDYAINKRYCNLYGLGYRAPATIGRVECDNASLRFLVQGLRFQGVDEGLTPPSEGFGNGPDNHGEHDPLSFGRRHAVAFRHQPAPARAA